MTLMVAGGFEPRPPDCSGCKVSGLQHGATTPSIFLLYCYIFIGRTCCVYLNHSLFGRAIEESRNI